MLRGVDVVLQLVGIKALDVAAGILSGLSDQAMT
jgi:hypothetical protein